MPLLPKYIRDLRYQIFYGIFLKKGYELLDLGGANSICRWVICPKGLNAKSVVYSGGVGGDITFEQALVKRFGCQITLLDPSPTGIKTMERSENQIPEFRFLPMALTARAGELTLAPPAEADGESWFASKDAKNSIKVPCTDVGTLMRQNGHDHVDLLKLDIEGCEYEVIDDILDKKIPVRQLCADFDYGYVPGVKRSQAIRSILKLARNGFRLIDRTGANHTFIRENLS